MAITTPQQPNRSRWKNFIKTCFFKRVRAAVTDHWKCVWTVRHRLSYRSYLSHAKRTSFRAKSFKKNCVSAFLSRKHLDKSACLCYYIFCKWHAFICSDYIFRGIAQLVEQRSPNGNRKRFCRIITGFLRLETSVSSLFSCFDFWKFINQIMQNRTQKPEKILEQHQ